MIAFRLAMIGGFFAVCRGHWVLEKFAREANCAKDTFATIHVDYLLWDQVHAVLNRTETPSIDQLARIAEGILIPVNGEVDPTLALQCPLGTAALLQQLGLQVLAAGESPKALRILHLAKLFAFHKYPELGDDIEDTRWKVNINQLMTAIKYAADLEKSPSTFNHSFKSHSRVRLTIVSYCYYPTGHTRLAEYSKANKELYGRVADVHVVHHDRPFSNASHAWMNKLLAVERALQEGQQGEWVMWLDCDAFFMNKNFHVENFLGSVDEGKHLIISEDANMLNSASFFLRNSQWSRNFLKKVRDLLTAPSPFSFRDNAYHEQSPLMYLILIPSIFKTGVDTKGYAPEVLLVDQKLINAYPAEIALRSNFMHHALYEDGDWIISFNGCGSLLGGEHCEELWRKHFHRSMNLLA